MSDRPDIEIDIMTRAGTDNYDNLLNKPSINNVVLIGNKTGKELGLLEEEVDPTVPQHIKEISEENINNWNNKAEKSEIPDVSQFITNSVDNLINYYLKNETYTKQEVLKLISNIQMVHFEIVYTLPTENIDTTAIYLLPMLKPSGNNYYEEYIYINEKWELIGTTDIDLSNYVTTDILNSYLQNYVLKSELSKIATSGDYNDLNNKPIIPMQTSDLINTGENGTSPYATQEFVEQHTLIVDLSNYYTKEEVNSQLPTMTILWEE